MNINMTMSFKVNSSESKKISKNWSRMLMNVSTGMSLSVSPSESMGMSLIMSSSA